MVQTEASRGESWLQGEWLGLCEKDWGLLISSSVSQFPKHTRTWAHACRHTKTSPHTRRKNTDAGTHTWTWTCVCLCPYKQTLVHTHTHTHTGSSSICSHTTIHTDTHRGTFTHRPTHTGTQMHARMHVRAHTYTHVHPPSVIPSNPLASPKLAQTIFPRPFLAERVIPKLSTRRCSGARIQAFPARGRLERGASELWGDPPFHLITEKATGGDLLGSQPVIPALFPYGDCGQKWGVGQNLSLSRSCLERKVGETSAVEGSRALTGAVPSSPAL